jgi:hypothetical protein
MKRKMTFTDSYDAFGEIEEIFTTFFALYFGLINLTASRLLGVLVFGKSIKGIFICWLWNMILLSILTNLTNFYFF